jgi:hypothetical protein
VALVRERTIPTERPPLVGEVHLFNLDPVPIAIWAVSFDPVISLHPISTFLPLTNPSNNFQISGTPA